MFQKGDIVYIKDNKYGVVEAKIIKKSGTYATIKLIDYESSYTVPEHRLSKVKEELPGNPPKPPMLH